MSRPMRLSPHVCRIPASAPARATTHAPKPAPPSQSVQAPFKRAPTTMGIWQLHGLAVHKKPALPTGVAPRAAACATPAPAGYQRQNNGSFKATAAFFRGMFWPALMSGNLVALAFLASGRDAADKDAYDALRLPLYY